MKERILILTNHQIKSSPFVDDIIKYSINDFDKVYYVSKEKDRGGKKISDQFFVKIRFKSYFFSFLSLIYDFFSFKNFKNIKNALTFKKFSFKFLIFTLIQLYNSNLYFYSIKALIKKHKNHDISLFSMWFWTESLAVAKLKKKYKGIKSSSLIHAFEVDDYRNNYSLLLFNEYRHKYFDQLIFISEKKLKYYISITKKEFILEFDKLKVNYLGTFKEGENLTKFSTNQTLRIMTCSSVNKVKRLDLIIDALSEWNKTNIEWTHIGDGTLFNDLKQYAKVKLGNKLNIKYNLLGYIDNANIIDIYLSREIDLFINVSSTEGIPVSIMEALSCGIPIVATNVGGTSEIVNDKNGFILNSNFSNKNIHGIFDIYLNMNQSEKINLRKNAFYSWNSNFNAIKNYKSLMELLKN